MLVPYIALIIVLAVSNSLLVQKAFQHGTSAISFKGKMAVLMYFIATIVVINMVSEIDKVDRDRQWSWFAWFLAIMAGFDWFARSVISCAKLPVIAQ